MKEIQKMINSLIGCGVALALVSTLAAQTPVEGKATVIRLKGAARYVVGTQSWKPLKVGQVLPPGCVIQTDMNKGSYVDLVLGEGSVPVLALYTNLGPTTAVGLRVPVAQAPAKPATSQNVVRLWENTVLGIDKLTSLQTGVDVVTDTQLDLRAGHIMGVVKKMPAASRYEIKIPDGVAGIRGTIYELWAKGDASVSEGKMILVRTKKHAREKKGEPPLPETITITLRGDQAYDAETGKITSGVRSLLQEIAPELVVLGTTTVPTPAFDLTVRNISQHKP